MTQFRFFSLAAAVFAASTLIACNTAPSMPMRSASAQGMGAPGQMGKMDMGKMDAQMKKMREMHEKMAAAKTPDERNKLMAEHMKTMQDGMQMMGGMGTGGMGGMAGGGMGGAGMGGNSGTPGDMAARQQMMEKHMEMMQSMMQMMMDRMPAAPAR